MALHNLILAWERFLNCFKVNVRLISSSNIIWILAVIITVGHATAAGALGRTADIFENISRMILGLLGGVYILISLLVTKASVINILLGLWRLALCPPITLPGFFPSVAESIFLRVFMRSIQ
jgi:hypothetical protein